jgi:SH3 domain-containing YSC84-like protein 1
MTRSLSLAILFFVFFRVAAVRGDQTKTDAVDRLDSSAKTLQQIVAAPDKGIPDEVLSGAKCTANVPNMLKVGFIAGAQHGRGVSTCRPPNKSWSAPAFFTISGGSWAAQIGVEDVQLVMMIMNDGGMRQLLQNKFQIGGSTSAATGTVGRHASAGTDWKVETQISRSRALMVYSPGSTWEVHG